MTPNDPLTDTERLTLALQENTQTLQDLIVAVLTVASHLTYDRVFGVSDSRPIEERLEDRSHTLPTIHQDEQ